MNIEQLKAQVEAKMKANAVELNEKVEIARLTAKLKLESSEALMAAKVHVAANEAQTSKLQRLVDECAGIVASMPVHNKKTRSNRVWVKSYKFDYGTPVNLMYQLSAGILFSCAEHKEMMLMHTGLTLELCEQFVNSFGSPMYYSRNYHTIEPAKPYNLELLSSTVQVMQSVLDVVVDTTALTESNLEKEFVKAEVTANNNFDKANEAISEADFTL